MIVTVTFKREVEQLPKSCSVCPFVDACDRMIDGITKRGGMEFTVRATRGRVKGCPIICGDMILDGEVPHETAWTTKPLASE